MHIAAFTIALVRVRFPLADPSRCPRSIRAAPIRSDPPSRAVGVSNRRSFSNRAILDRDRHSAPRPRVCRPPRARARRALRRATAARARSNGRLACANARVDAAFVERWRSRVVAMVFDDARARRGRRRERVRRHGRELRARRDELGETRLRQVPGAVVRALQVDETGVGSTGGGLQGQRERDDRRRGLHGGGIGDVR